MNSCDSKQRNSGQTQLKKWKPPIGTRPFQELTPQEFRDYVIGLYEEVKKKDIGKKALPYNLRFNEKGTMIITVRRKPKQLTYAEIEQLSSEKEVPINRIWNYCKKKEISIVEDISEVQPKATS